MLFVKSKPQTILLIGFLVVILAVAGVTYGFYSRDFKPGPKTIKNIPEVSPIPTPADQLETEVMTTPMATQSAANTAENIATLQAEIKVKQGQVYAAKIKYNDYRQGQMVRAKGQAEIDRFKKNYPFILDPNLDSLTAQAKANYEKLQAELATLQAKLATLQQNKSE